MDFLNRLSDCLKTKKRTVLLFFALAFYPFGLLAQDMWGTYCLWGTDNIKICRQTADEALAAYNESLPNSPLWELSGEEFATSEIGKIAIGYRRAILPPVSVSSEIYNYNSSISVIGTGSFFGIPDCAFYGCDSEEQVVEYLTNGIKEIHPDATITVSGEYNPEFKVAAIGMLNFSNNRELVVITGSGTEYSYQLNKFKEFSCRAGHASNAGWNIGYAPVNKKASELSFQQLCGGRSGLWVTAILQQRKSCAVNANPCYPTTGDKARFEKDFEFAGREFIRSYHSTQQVSMPGVAPGWWITFGERTSYANGVDEFGYVDLYRFSDDGSYQSILHANRRVWTTQSGYTSRDQDGTFRDFDGSGTLVNLYDPLHPEKDIWVHYDVWGRISRLVDSRGREAIFTYTDGSSSGLLASVELPDGSTVNYEYSEGRLTSVEFPDGSRKRYLYNENGLAPVAGSSTKTNLLTGIVDEAGRRYASFGYDERGRVLSSELHSESGPVEQTSISYGVNSAAVTTDGSGIRTYSYSPYDVPVLTSINVSGVGRYKKQYSLGSGIVTWEADPDGNSTSYKYVNGYLAGVHEAEGESEERRTVFSRDLLGNVTQRVVRQKVAGVFQDALTVDKSYNTRDQVLTTSQTDSVSGAMRVTTTTYCEQTDIAAGICPLLGLKMSVEGPRADVVDLTTYQYYLDDHPDCAAAPVTCAWRKGDLWKVTNALGQVTEMLRYDGADRVLSVKDPNGVITDFEYHTRGWLVARKVRGTNDTVETDDQITRIEYWPTGLVKRVTQPGGAFTAYTYDAAHRLTNITDNAGNTIHYTLDNAGNRIQEDTKDASGALKRTLSRVYNQLGRLVTSADADANPTDFAYDPNGNLDTVTDAFGRVTDSDYDPLNRLARTLQDVGGIDAETVYEYDALDNLTKVTDPKDLDTIYAYNGFGDLTQVTSPDTGTTTYTYDSAGNRETQTDARGVTTSYSYDALNRPTAIAYSITGPDIAYVYDTASPACATGETFAVGRLATVADTSGSIDYCYNRFGDLVRKVQITNGQVFTLRYTYAKAGQLSSMTYPDGTVVDYVRNGQGQAVEVGVSPQGGVRSVLLGQAAYLPFGPVIGWDWGNGRSLSRSYTLNYQPETILDSAPGGLSLHYGFDAVGNLTNLKDGTQTTSLVQYDYDALGRLAVTRDGPTGTPIETYSYDATGNRTGLTNAGGTATYTYPADSHHLASIGGIARSYDAAGNTLSIGGTVKEFVYDVANRLSQVKQGGIVTTRYAYNGRGERVRKYLSETSTNQIYTVYDEAGHWIGDYDNTGASIQQAIWLDNLPVGLLVGADSGQKLHYVEADHLGTPRVVIDPIRDVTVWKWDAKGEAFGNTVPDQDPDGDGTAFVFDMRFPGQRYDAASGLNYNLNRDYEAATGRYPTSDPVGHLGGINTYAYATSNPLTWFDPDGLAATTIPYPGAPPYTRPGPRPMPFPWAPATPACLNPIVGGILLMMVPMNIGQDASCSDDPMKRRQECRDDDDEECAKRLEREETLCRLLAGPRYPGDPERAVKICQSAAFRRYAACLRGTPESEWPPLTGIDTPI